MAAASNFYSIEAEDGQKIDLTLNYARLYKLKATDSEAYAAYNQVMTKGAKDEFDNIRILYTGYLCAYLAENAKTEGAMDFEEFMSILPPDRDIVMGAVAMLIAPKKAKASGVLS